MPPKIIDLKHAGKSLWSRPHSAFFEMDYSELVSFESELAACYEAEYLLSIERHDTSLGSASSSQVGWLFPNPIERQRNHQVAVDVSPSDGSAVNHSLVEPACPIHYRELSVFAASVPSRSLHNSWTPPTAGDEAEGCPCIVQLSADRKGETHPVYPCERKRKCVNSSSTAQLQGGAIGGNSVVFSLWGALVGGVAHANVAGAAMGPACATGSCGGVGGPLPAKRHKAEASIPTGLY